MAALVHELEKDRSRAFGRTMVLLGVALAAGLLAAKVVADGRHRAAPCTDVTTQLAGLWDGPRKDALRGRYFALDTSWAREREETTERTLDVYAARWVEQRKDACEATLVRKDQSAELMDLRVECLRDRAKALATLATLLASAGEVELDRGPQAALALPDLDRCADARSLRATARPPENASAKALAEDASEHLNRALSLAELGRNGDALGEAGEAVAKARASGYSPTLARAQLAVACQQGLAGQYEAVRDTLHEAARSADEGGDDATVIQAWSQLVSLVGADLNRFEDAAQWYAYADARLSRVGRPEGLRGHLLASWARALIEADRTEEGIAAFRGAEAVFSDGPARDLDRLAFVRMNLGIASTKVMDLPSARRSLETAIELYERTRGATSLEVAMAHQNSPGPSRRGSPQ